MGERSGHRAGRTAGMIVVAAMVTGLLAVPNGLVEDPPVEMVAGPAEAATVGRPGPQAPARRATSPAPSNDSTGAEDSAPSPSEAVETVASDQDDFADEDFDPEALTEDGFDADVFVDQPVPDEVAGVSLGRTPPPVVVVLDTDVDPSVSSGGALSATEIYRVARGAGFDSRDATVFTAIALAESGGRPTAHNGRGEDSWGLWQINLDAHHAWASSLDLTDPAQNAAAAFRVARGGDTTLPWTVTHAWTGKPYLRHLGVALAAAAAVDGSGDWAWLIEDARWRDHFDGVVDEQGGPVVSTPTGRSAPPTSAADPKPDGAAQAPMLVDEPDADVAAVGRALPDPVVSPDSTDTDGVGDEAEDRVDADDFDDASSDPAPAREGDPETAGDPGGAEEEPVEEFVVVIDPEVLDDELEVVDPEPAVEEGQAEEEPVEEFVVVIDPEVLDDELEVVDPEPAGEDEVEDEETDEPDEVEEVDEADEVEGIEGIEGSEEVDEADEVEGIDGPEELDEVDEADELDEVDEADEVEAEDAVTDAEPDAADPQPELPLAIDPVPAPDCAEASEVCDPCVAGAADPCVADCPETVDATLEASETPPAENPVESLSPHDADEPAAVADAEDPVVETPPCLPLCPEGPEPTEPCAEVPAAHDCIVAEGEPCRIDDDLEMSEELVPSE